MLSCDIFVNLMVPSFLDIFLQFWFRIIVQCGFCYLMCFLIASSFIFLIVCSSNSECVHMKSCFFSIFLCSYYVLVNSSALHFCTTRSTIAVLARGQQRRRGKPNSISTKTAFLWYPVDWCFVFSMILCFVYSQFRNSFVFQFA